MECDALGANNGMWGMRLQIGKVKPLDECETAEIIDTTGFKNYYAKLLMSSLSLNT